MHPVCEYLISLTYAAQKSEEWLALRGNMLTASDAATAIGENHYQTPHDLLLKKCGLGEKFTGNDATRWGEKYEDVARELYEERYGEKVHEIGLVPHPEHKWLGGSPDGVSESGKLIEIKCPMMRKIIPGEVPAHYVPQIQLCMEILNLESCDFIQYAPTELTWPEPEVLDVTHVKRDRAWFAKYLPVMDAFWKKVLYHREHGGLEAPPPKKTRPRKPKEPKACEIVDVPDDDDYFSD